MLARRWVLVWALAVPFALLTGAPAASAQGASWAPGEVLVRFADTTSATERREARRSVAAERPRSAGVPGWQRVQLPEDRTVREAVRELVDQPGVIDAEPNYRFQATQAPSDPGFAQQWGLHNAGGTVRGVPASAGADIGVLDAWGVTMGSRSVRVGIVDSGMRSADPDLAANVDLGRARDYVDGDRDAFDAAGHGTHVAGIVGGADDGRGIVGVSPRVTMTPYRVLDENGSGTAEAVAEGLAQAGRDGLRVVNVSLGSEGPSQIIRDAIARAPKTLFVVAAGNGGADLSARNEDYYPCVFPEPNILCVGATDQQDRLAEFSNFGEDVDILAPGVDILSPFAQEWVAFDEDFEDPLGPEWDVGPGPEGRTAWQRSTAWAGGGRWSLSDSPGTADTAVEPRLTRTGTIDIGTRRACEWRLAVRMDAEGAYPALSIEAHLPEYSDDFGGNRALNGDRSVRHLRMGVYFPSIEGFRPRYSAVRLVSHVSRMFPGSGGIDIDDLSLRCRDPSIRGTQLEILSGTSMAAPHVTGVAALLLAQDPTRSTAQLKARILDSAERLESLGGLSAAGRLDAGQALRGVTTAWPTAGHPTISTVAGGGETPASGDGGPATEANVGIPRDVAALPGGGFLIADGGWNRIREVAPDGTISTRVSQDQLRDPSTGTDFASPDTLTVGPDDSLYVWDGRGAVVRRVDAAGRVRTIAGANQSADYRPGMPATQFRVYGIHRMAVDRDGVLYLNSGRIDRVLPDGRYYQTAVSGNTITPWRDEFLLGPDAYDPATDRSTPVFGTPDPDWTDGGPLESWNGTMVDAAATPDGGFVFLASGSNLVWRATPDGRVFRLAGMREDGFAGDGGRAAWAHLSSPTGIDVQPDGGVLVSERGNDRVRRISDYRPAAERATPPGPGPSTGPSPTPGPADGPSGTDAPSADPFDGGAPAAVDPGMPGDPAPAPPAASAPTTAPGRAARIPVVRQPRRLTSRRLARGVAVTVRAHAPGRVRLRLQTRARSGMSWQTRITVLRAVRRAGLVRLQLRGRARIDGRTQWRLVASLTPDGG